jgi:uncharacterized protein (TIGR03083 family)
MRIDALEEHGRALAAAADKAGLDADVPSCPTWTVRSLVAHTGMVHRWAATYVREGPAATAGGKHPTLATAPADGLLDWYVGGHAALVAALRAAPPDLECWTFLPAPSALAFWARRQAHETAIHRADAEAAAGAVPDFPAEFADDGLGELIGGFMARRGGTLRADPARTLLIAPTDTGSRWHVTIGPDGRQVSTEGAVPTETPGQAEPPGQADCTVSGRATDLYLLLWNREPARPAETSGDPEVLRLWHELAKVRWR